MSLFVSSVDAIGNKTRNLASESNNQVVCGKLVLEETNEIFCTETCCLGPETEIALVSCFTSLPHGLLPYDDYHSLFTLVIDSLFFSG